MKKKIYFKAIKVPSKPVKVEFYTKEGKKVDFRKVKDIPKPLKVEFYQRSYTNQ